MALRSAAGRAGDPGLDIAEVAMEFHVAVQGTPPDLDAVERALAAFDPAALVDLDPTGARLRVSTSVGAVQLATLLGRVGCPVEADGIVLQPSVCCGGCSG